MGEVTRRCGAMRTFAMTEEAIVAVECVRRRHHRKKHKSSWREGRGSRYVDIVVKWPRRR